MSARAIEAELEASEPWRRSKQFIAKPYGERNRDVAKRFLKHFLDGAEGLEMPGSEWTYADVFRGDDEGGSNNPMGAAAAAVLAAKRRRRNVRVGKAIALFKTHMLIETIKEHVRQNYANDPEGVIDWFERTECGGATSEPAVNEIKAEMTAATLLGTVGYKLGSVSSFALCLQQMNCRISDVNDRFEEHDLAVFVLDKLAKAALRWTPRHRCATMLGGHGEDHDHDRHGRERSREGSSGEPRMARIAPRWERGSAPAAPCGAMPSR